MTATTWAATWSARRASRRPSTRTCAATPVTSRWRWMRSGVASGCCRKSRTARAGRSHSPSTVTSRKPPTAPSARPTGRSSRSTFDPNVFARGIRSAEWRTLVEDRKHPLNNRAVQGVFPPGSTFKVAVATGALEEGVVTPFTGVTCTGGMPFGNHFFHCWKKGGHGAVDLHKAIVESCDVFFYQVGRRLGVDGIAEYAHRLGLGLPTGIALPHEQTGTIPDTEWKRRRFGQPWFESVSPS